MIVLMQRRSGMWKRLQAAPISRFTVIGSRAASAAIIAMIILAVVFGFARVVFGVKIEGSFAGLRGRLRGVRDHDGDVRTARSRCWGRRPRGRAASRFW